MAENGSGGQAVREVSVLVVYANFAVATAVAQRLLDHASVELARPRSAMLHLAGGRRYDAVVICPYISPTDRERVLDRCHSSAAPTTSIDLLDTEAGLRVDVHDCPGDRAPENVTVLRPRRDGSLDAVIAALRAAGQETAH